MNDRARHILERFLGKKHTIDLRIAKDPEFLTLCEDHDACVDALRYYANSETPEAEARVNEYRTLVRELREEIDQGLAALELRWLD